MISPFGPRALVTSVWHVAHSSDWRTCSDSVGSNPVADRMIVEIPRSMRNGPNIGRGARAFARRDDISAREARRSAEVLIGDLMAERAGDAIVRELVGAIAARRLTGRCAKTSPFGAPHARFGARHRHMARRALILDGAGERRVVEHFPSYAGLPVRIAGGLAIIEARQLAPIETSSPDGARRPL